MSKFLGVFVLGLALVGCGQQHQTDVINGKDGKDGNNGIDGYSLVAKSISNPSLCGSAGGTTVYLALDLNRDLNFDDNDEVQTQYVTCNGTKGDKGDTGATGATGMAGSSCTVNKVGSAATITCGSSHVVVVDGATGAKGDKGDKGDTGATGPAGTNASGIYITEIINPCGDESLVNEEIFLRLSTGRILALYDGVPQQDRLALIEPGNYITTDNVQNRSCSFTITNDYQITNEVRH
jgi:hypothetical protein